MTRPAHWRTAAEYECRWCGAAYHPVAVKPVGLYCSTPCRAQAVSARHRRTQELIEAAAAKTMPPVQIAAELAKLKRPTPKLWVEREDDLQ